MNNKSFLVILALVLAEKRGNLRVGNWQINIFKLDDGEGNIDQAILYALFRGKIQQISKLFVTVNVLAFVQI